MTIISTRVWPGQWGLAYIPTPVALQVPILPPQYVLMLDLVFPSGIP
jgi:hypothetical protein